MSGIWSVGRVLGQKGPVAVYRSCAVEYWRIVFAYLAIGTRMLGNLRLQSYKRLCMLKGHYQTAKCVVSFLVLLNTIGTSEPI